MADLVKLKPCPFCGTGPSDDHSAEQVQIYTSRDWFYTHCEVCGSETADYPSRDEAIAAWNTRALTNDAPVEAAWRDGHGVGRRGGDVLSEDDDWLDSDTRAALSSTSGEPVVGEQHQPVPEIVDHATTGKWLCEKCDKTWAWNTPAPANCTKPTPTDTADRREAATGAAYVAIYGNEMEPLEHPEGWEYAQSVADAVLASLISSPPTVGEGWVLVPREPTEAMLSSCRSEFSPPGTNLVSKGIWSAMIAASPNPEGDA